MGRDRINEPSKSGVAIRSSTGWFGVVDGKGEMVTHRLWESSLRAAEWATEAFGKSWPELYALGVTVRGGYQADGEAKSQPRNANGIVNASLMGCLLETNQQLVELRREIAELSERLDTQVVIARGGLVHE